MFFLLTIITGIFAQIMVSDRLVVMRDAAATAANIASQESLFRLGFSVYMVEMACQIAMTILLYQLLKPVSRTVSLLAAAFGIIGCTIKILSRLFYYAPLLVLDGTPWLAEFTAPQLNAVSLLLLKINDRGAAIALVFMGLNTLLGGWLILRSTFLPRALGLITIIGGAGWLLYVSPPLGDRYFAFIAGVALLGSVYKIGWFLVVGVNETRWREQAAASATSIWR